MNDAESHVMTLFDEARKLPPGPQQTEYLDRACGDNSALRVEVEDLLKAHDMVGEFLEPGSSLAGAPQTVDHLVSESPGTRIGPYKIVELIGEGGMGAVYLAQQTEPVKRLVALKVIKAGMDSKQVIARFEAERQALALMDHPNIAKVLDAGTTDAGRPYFVMDLVKGVPITRFCDERKLTPRERLELFLPVCHAIQHAHQKGLIHRDLKPSNILVALYDGRPVPKVIDFGVAKAAGQPLTEKTLVTGLGAVVGTPEYMSPEQAELNQLDIDTRSDIYSLGILLYELLTGTTPLDRNRVKEKGLLEVLRIVREEEAPTLGNRLSTTDELPTIADKRGLPPAKLTQLVRGELDWIVMKALEKDRSRRYETANSLAMDVQRYLTGEAVRAVPPSVGYQLRKFARRNKVTLAFTALLLLIVLTLAGGIGWNLRDRAARQAAIEQEARRALDEAEWSLEQGKWLEALAAVKRGAGLLAGGDNSELRDQVQQLRKDLEMILRLEDIGLLATEIKNNRLDWNVVDQGYAKAFADYGIDVLNLPVEEAAARIRARDRLAIPLAVTLDDWASTQSSRTEADRAKMRAVAGAIDPDPWRRRVREAVQKWDGKALAELAGSPDLARQPRTSLVVLKHGLRFHGLSDQSLEVLRVLQRQYPGDFWVNYWLAHELSLSPHADRDEAISFASAALALRPKSAAAYLLLAITLREKGNYDRAIICHYKAIELAPNYAYARNDLGWTLYKQGKPDEAIVCFQKASELDPKDAWPHLTIGITRRDQGKLDEALASFRKAIELDPKYAHAYHDRGWALHLQGKLDEAIVCYRKAIELNAKDTYAYFFLGHTLRAQNKPIEAIAAYRKAIDVDANYADACNSLAWVYLTAPEAPRDVKAALPLAERAVRLVPQSVMYRNTLGAAYYRDGRYLQAVDILRPNLDRPEHWSLAFDLYLLAMSHQKLDETALARDYYDRAVRLTETQKGPSPEQLEVLHMFRGEAEELLRIEKKK